MVVSLLSLPGVLNPELAEQFKLAIEQAAQKSLESYAQERMELLETLIGENRQDTEGQGEKVEDNGANKKGPTEVEGYRMEKIESRDDSTKVTSSGVEWLSGLVVLVIIGLAALGTRKTV